MPCVKMPDQMIGYWNDPANPAEGFHSTTNPEELYDKKFDGDQFVGVYKLVGHAKLKAVVMVGPIEDPAA